MNNTPEIITRNEGSAVCQKLKALKDLSVSADYDVTLKLTDRSGAKTSECAHHLKGNSKHSLGNILAIGGLITAAVAATVCFVHVFCSFVCRAR
jgi:hypothetical protein